MAKISINHTLTNFNNKIFEKLWKETKKDKISLKQKKDSLKTLKGAKYKMIDTHVHIVNFLQETEGLKSLLYYMKKGNIDGAVIFGTALKKIWAENERERPDYYLDDDNPCYYDSSTDLIVAKEFLSLNKTDRERFFPLLCGFNPMDINAVDYIEKMFKFYPGVFCGIGEILYRHDDLTFQTFGEPPRMNTEATRRIVEFAVKYDLPVLVHNNISSPGVSDYPKYLHELEEILREFPKAKIVFAHCGASRRINAPYYAKMIERLLREYPALMIDYSWVIYDEIIAINDDSMKEWLDLTEKFSTRIMIGSDILGTGFHKIGIINARYNKFLKLLSEKARKNICYNNAINLYKDSRNGVENGLERKTYSLEEF